MRIAARWIGWYSLLVAAVGIGASLVAASVPPAGPLERLSKSDNERVEVQRIIDRATDTLCKVEHLR